jgi:hypothetical protein
MEHFKLFAQENGIEIVTVEENDLPENQIEVKSFPIPPSVITEINSNINVGDYYINKVRKFSEKILKVDLLVCSPEGRLEWTIPTDLAEEENFLVICADEIICHAPPTSDQMCTIDLISPFTNQPVPKRPKRQKGYTPPQPVGSNGQDGGNGGVGEQGEEGICYNYPLVYIFYNKFTIELANPTITRGLRIVGNGINGGDGGDGGDGGNGSQGGRGSDGETGWTLGLPYCKAGPGAGGNGGNSAGGGKGGNAGKGGDGMNIRVLAPIKKTHHLEVFQNKGIKGNPGNPGNDGTPGKVGTFGSKPSACPTYPASAKQDGILIPNPEKNIGDDNIDGTDGLTLFQTRTNSDIIF